MPLMNASAITPHNIDEFKKKLITFKELIPAIEAALSLSKIDEAAKFIRKLPDCLTNNPEADCQIAGLFCLINDTQRAQHILKETLKNHPGNETALEMLFSIYENHADKSQIIALIEKAIQIKPSANLFFLLGNHYFTRGFSEAAKICFQTAEKLDPFSPAYKIASRLHFLNFFENREEEKIQLEKLMQDLEALERIDFSKNQLERNVPIMAGPLFNIAYNYVNPKPYIQKLSNVLRKATPIINYIAPHTTKWKPKKPAQKVRLVFISVFLCKKNHSVSNIYRRIIENLDKNKFEIIIFHGKLPKSQFVPIKNAKHIPLQQQIFLDLKKISSVKPDILVYTDIGMEVTTYSLAHMRLAPIQCALTGHPVSTGISTIDYYISNKLLSPPEADELHTEKIIRLNCLPSLYEKIHFTPLDVTPATYNLPIDKTIYYCPGLSFKIHPRMDSAFKRILEGDKNSIIVLAAAPLPDRNLAIKNRLQAFLGDELLERIYMLPFMEKNLYYNLLKLSDVVLDTYHFGGGNTNFQCIALGVPFITMVDKFIPSRVGYAIYTTMGDFSELIAFDEDEYVHKALVLGKDKNLYQTLSKRLLKNNHKILENQDIIHEHEQFFYEIAQRPIGSKWP